MKKEIVIGGIVGLIIGGALVGVTAALSVNNDNRSMMKMMGMDTSHMMNTSSGHMGMSMDQMSDELKNRTGDDFDENFVAMMIAHHQGAIDMAKLSEARAKHDEVKQLSKEIITAQTKEIEAMKQWQQAWDYSENNSTHNMH